MVAREITPRPTRVAQDKKSFFESIGCNAEIVKICVRDTNKPRDFLVGPNTKVKGRGGGGGRIRESALSLSLALSGIAKRDSSVQKCWCAAKRRGPLPLARAARTGIGSSRGQSHAMWIASLSLI